MRILSYGRATNPVAFLLLAAAMAAASLWAGYRLAEGYYVQRELESSARRAAPYLTSLVSVLERYQNIPPILSEDQEIIEALLGSPSGDLNERLARYSESTGADAVYLMNNDGWTVAASNWQEPKTFLGQNYGFRPYFKTALSGLPGEYFAVGATTGIPGYFVSHPVRNEETRIIGVIAVKVDLRRLEADWETPDGKVFITNRHGVIVLTGQSAWRYRTVSELAADVRTRIANSRQFGAADLIPVKMERNGQTVAIDSARFVEHTADVGRLDWTLHFLSPYSRVEERSRFVLAAGAVALSLLLALLLFRRSERMRGLLASSQEERDTLNRLNQDLEREIEERIQTEARLKSAQKELRRASKLAVLGQLAASVSHELGQPLSAMKTYIAGARLPSQGAPCATMNDEAESEEVLGQLDRLVDRMSETTRELKFFARRGGEAFDDVNLSEVISGALETMRPATIAEGVTLTCRNGAEDVIVRGGRMRLEQVLINLIRNGLDAMHQTEEKKLSISLEHDARQARIVVRDTGVGFSSDQETGIFEPFVTTKASGEGLGLGLAISTGIVDEHGGRLSARNVASGGAEFVMELPLSRGATDADN